MASFPNISKRRVVVDNIHGDIELSGPEWEVVNTTSFQRLRRIKQLGMGHLTYPNATHTRFAHSIGVFGIMCRITERLKTQRRRMRTRMVENLRLAALLHDVGHYPYSHLMERIDFVRLTEEELDGQKQVRLSRKLYPDHEEVGRDILTHQKDIVDALGGAGRAKEVGDLFSRSMAANQQYSKLIHSSLDMDRLDYLMRDARAAGVPYGVIDINYLLNNIRMSPKGMLGVEHKAIAAAEHFLLARLFMHRAVYYHKTTFAFEECCRQLLRRLRDGGTNGVPADGKAVLSICRGRELANFTDDYVDRIIIEAASAAKDPVAKALARCIVTRKPPRLLAEVCGLEKKGDKLSAAEFFWEKCKDNLAQLAASTGIPLGRFLLCRPKAVKIEERGSLLTREDAQNLKPEEREELILVFARGSQEPKSLVEVTNTIAQTLAQHQYGICRLYLADPDGAYASNGALTEIEKQVRSWPRN